MSGWIKLHRQLSSSDLWKSETFTRGQAWVDLILLANHKEGFIRARGIRVDIKRGQVGFSQETLSKRWKWSRGKVKRFLNELEMDQQIVQQKNNVTSLLSIVKYNEYQSSGTADSTADSTANDTANGQQTDTNKKNKNNKEEKESNTMSWLDSADPIYLSKCEKFYNKLHELGRVKKNTEWKSKSWYDAFRLLLTADGVSAEEFKEVMNYYFSTPRGKYTPIADSPVSVREKWQKLKDYKGNNTQMNNSNLSTRP